MLQLFLNHFSKNICHGIRRITIMHPSWLKASHCTSFQSTKKIFRPDAEKKTKTNTTRTQMEQFSLFLSTITVVPLGKSASTQCDKPSVVCSKIQENYNFIWWQAHVWVNISRMIYKWTAKQSSLWTSLSFQNVLNYVASFAVIVH